MCCVIFISSQTIRTLAIELSVKAVGSDKSKMSLDKSRIPKLSDSSRKFIPQKQKKTNERPFFLERIARTRTHKGKKISGGMVETMSQKSSEGQKAMLEVEVHPDPDMEEHGPQGS